MATFVTNAPQLDSVIREILSLQMNEIEYQSTGTLRVVYTDETVKNAVTIPMLEIKGFAIVWEQQQPD